MKIALIGYGKMGKTIEQLALKKGHTIVYTSNNNIKQGSLNKADVAIEFSTPEAAVYNIKNCFTQGIPVVCGTTGWLEHYDEVLSFCEKSNGSFIYASNFSVGVNLFFNLNEYLAKLMQPWQDYTPNIEEIHHLEKKDAPSGTAISLAQGILKNTTLNNWVLNKEEVNSLTIKAIREGDVKGTHHIYYNSPIDTIKITHEAKNRDGFALGAILAAEWLQNKKGVYSMKDVLQIKNLT